MARMYSVEEVLGLAPDASSASAGRGLSSATKWKSLGQREEAIWGECQGSGKDPYLVRVDLSEPAFKCSCPSRKFPCKHGLGILLLWAGSSSLFVAGDPPGWVSEWLESRAGRAAKKAERVEEQARRDADPAAQARRAERRDSRVAGGVDELETWMRDLMRRGLVAAQGEGYDFWNRMAARLVDAQAPGLARQVQLLAELSASGDGSGDRVLRQVGRLYLLLRAYRQLDSLPGGLQDEVRSQIGFVQTKDQLMSLDGVADRWFCWAQYAEEIDQGLRVQRSWLFGLSSGQRALALSYARQGAGFDTSFVPGMSHEAELVFYPSSLPRRVVVKSRGQETAADRLPGFDSIEAAFAAYGAELAINPWLDSFPMPLSKVRLARRGEGFVLMDSRNHALELRAPAESLWSAYAATWGEPSTFFGEWDETSLRVLAYAHGGVYTAMGG